MTFARIQELKQERVGLHEKIKQILDTPEDKRAEDAGVVVDRMFDDIDKKDVEIKRLERSLGLSKQIDAEKGSTTIVDPVQEGREARELTKEERAIYSDVLRRYMINGRDTIHSVTDVEKRALLQAGSDIGGGHFILGQEMVSGILKKMDDEVFIRGQATKFQLPKAESLGQVTLDTDPDDFEWTTELKTGSEDQATAFGLRELYPHPMAKRLKISEKLIRSAAVDIEAFVMSRLAYKAGVTEEKAFLTGDGNKKPLGIMTASNLGIPTSRDVVAGSTTAVTADGLLDVYYSLKTQYLQKAVWGLSRALCKQLRKLKDGEGQYLWAPGIQAGQPDLILGRPFFMSENMPATFTSGLYLGFFGCLEYYYIADALNMRIQRLEELYAETNQVGFILRKETDAMPVLAEAFSRIKLA